MTDRTRLFRRVFESMMEGRKLQAQRFITEYVRSRTELSGRRED